MLPVDIIYVPWYINNMNKTHKPNKQIKVERVQTGMRLEKRLLKVLKAMAEYHDMTLGDLIEGICLHAFDGALPFDADQRRKITKLKEIYGLDLDAGASHLLHDAGAGDKTP